MGRLQTRKTKKKNKNTKQFGGEHLSGFVKSIKAVALITILKGPDTMKINV